MLAFRARAFDPLSPFQVSLELIIGRVSGKLSPRGGMHVARGVKERVVRNLAKAIEKVLRLS